MRGGQLAGGRDHANFLTQEVTVRAPAAGSSALRKSQVERLSCLAALELAALPGDSRAVPGHVQLRDITIKMEDQ